MLYSRMKAIVKKKMSFPARFRMESRRFFDLSARRSCELQSIHLVTINGRRAPLGCYQRFPGHLARRVNVPALQSGGMSIIPPRYVLRRRKGAPGCPLENRFLVGALEHFLAWRRR